MDADDRVNILLVDDELNLQELKKLIEDHFSDITGRIDLATSVSEARVYFAKKPYNLIVADIDFTKVNESEDSGLEILEFQKSHPELVVILMTDKAERSAVFKGAKMGALYFIPKTPSFAKEMLSRLAMVFAQVRSEKRIESLNLQIKPQNKYLSDYQIAIFRTIQFALSVILAMAALLLTARFVDENLYLILVFLGVLFFSAVFFELIHKFVFKVREKGLEKEREIELSASSVEKRDDVRR